MPPAAGVVVHVATSVLRGESVSGLGRLARELGLPALSLDLGGVHRVTAEGMGQLLALRRELRSTGAELTLVNISDGLWEVFEATGLTVRVRRNRRVPARSGRRVTLVAHGGVRRSAAWRPRRW
jgi:ABC-type transporter Mla MlaB component